MLADENPHLTANWIRDNAESLGFEKRGKGRGKWLASEQAINKAFSGCSTNSPHRSIGTLNSNTVEKPLGALLVKQINAMPKDSRRH